MATRVCKGLGVRCLYRPSPGGEWTWETAFWWRHWAGLVLEDYIYGPYSKPVSGRSPVVLLYKRPTVGKTEFSIDVVLMLMAVEIFFNIVFVILFGLPKIMKLNQCYLKLRRYYASLNFQFTL